MRFEGAPNIGVARPWLGAWRRGINATGARDGNPEDFLEQHASHYPSRGRYLCTPTSAGGMAPC
jgi:hypothetical protein